MNVQRRQTSRRSAITAAAVGSYKQIRPNSSSTASGVESVVPVEAMETSGCELCCCLVPAPGIGLLRAAQGRMKFEKRGQRLSTAWAGGRDDYWRGRRQRHRQEGDPN